MAGFICVCFITNGQPVPCCRLGVIIYQSKTGKLGDYYYRTGTTISSQCGWAPGTKFSIPFTSTCYLFYGIESVDESDATKIYCS